jgi:hypothetical protein
MRAGTSPTCEHRRTIMHQPQFDTVVAAFGRRRFTRGVASAAIAAALATRSLDGLSASTRQKRKKKPTVNQFGCRNVGVACANASQCCSGICEAGQRKKGRKTRKTCRAHNTGGCRLEDDSCLVGPVPCVASTGEDGFCQVTTGNAPYCAVRSVNFDCSRDEECVELCGAGAACGVCNDPELEPFRICAGLGTCIVAPER